MISLQINTQQIHDVASWNDLTVAGILVAFIFTFGFTIVYLFKHIQKMNADRDVLYDKYIQEVKGLNESVVKINNQYSDSINNLALLYKK